MAAGILAIGFAFIAGMFPVGVKLTAIATEQTIAPIVADEATAKIRLYGDPALRKKAQPVKKVGPKEKKILLDLAVLIYMNLLLLQRLLWKKAITQ